MMKLVGLLKRKDGMSPEDFAAYYENTHAPLATRLALHGRDYRRSYVTAARRDGAEGPAGSDFDVITEVWFPDEAAYQAFAAAMAEPHIRAQIVTDEERFIDRTATRIYIVDERTLPG